MKNRLLLLALLFIPFIGYGQVGVRSSDTALVATVGGTQQVWKSKNYYNNAFGTREKSSNKQNSLNADGSGIKFPTVDAINAAVVKLTTDQSISGKKTFNNGVKIKGGLLVEDDFKFSVWDETYEDSLIFSYDKDYAAFRMAGKTETSVANLSVGGSVIANSLFASEGIYSNSGNIEATNGSLKGKSTVVDTLYINPTTAAPLKMWRINTDNSADANLLFVNNATPTGASLSTGGLFRSIAAPVDATDLTNKAYVDGMVVGLLNDRGSIAAGGTYPTSGGSGPGGAIMKGNIWYISTSGSMGGYNVNPGDWVRALTDNPGTDNTKWSIAEGNLGYVPENVAYKANNLTLPNSTTYPSTLAVSSELNAYAKKDGSNATGTWGISTTQWNGFQNGFADPISSSQIDAIAGQYNDGRFYRFNPTALRNFIGSPSGGETLTSVLGRGNIGSQGQVLALRASDPNNGYLELKNDLNSNGTAFRLVSGVWSTSQDGFSIRNNRGTTPFYIGENDFIGIGTTTPGAKLSVNGNIYGTGELIADGKVTWGVGSYAPGGGIYNTSLSGTVVTSAIGSSTDLTVANGSGATVFSVPTGTSNMNVVGNVTAPNFIGNASSATILQTPRTINGVSFNGSANINITSPSNLNVGTKTGSSFSISNDNGTGVVMPMATSNFSGMMAAADKQKLDGVTTSSSGTYNPTFTNVSNTSSITNVKAYFLRVGNIIQVTAKFNAIPVDGNDIQLTMTLPTATTYASISDVIGVIQAYGTTTPPSNPAGSGSVNAFNPSGTITTCIIAAPNFSLSGTAYAVSFTYEVK